LAGLVPTAEVQKRVLSRTSRTMEANNQQGKAWRTYEEVAAYLLNRFAKE
jgi:hypothetical protein